MCMSACLSACMSACVFACMCTSMYGPKVSGNLLDDSSLIDTLALSKKTARALSEKSVNANETEKSIVVACDEFRPVATRGSVIYFVMSEMRFVNHMYQTGLAQFMELFNTSIDKSEKSNTSATRANAIIDQLTYTTYTYISCGLFDQDKLLYSLLLTLKIQTTAGVISADHFSCLIKGGAALDINQVMRLILPLRQNSCRWSLGLYSYGLYSYGSPPKLASLE